MKFSIHYKLIRAALFACALASAFPGAARAEVTDLADVPLANSPSDTVRPNLMYILDDSGSMAWDYMPDNILNLSSGTNLNNCKDSSGTISVCSDIPSGGQVASNWGEPPYYATQFNSIYYNPDITYTPGLDSTGTSLGNASTTAALKNPYSGTANLNLTTAYPEIYYCNIATTDSHGNPITLTAAQLADKTVCRRNGIDNVASGTATSYFMYWSNTAPPTTLPVTATQGGFPTGTTSSFNNQYVSTGHPYYYTITPNEYCADANLANCAIATAGGAAPDGTHTIPAPVRYCDTSAHATSASVVSDAVGTASPQCQLKFDVSNHKYPRYGRFVRTDIVSTTANYTKSATAVRTDCAATTFCTYAEELQNFANWYSYYRVRITMMKTSTGLAFNNIDDRYRVGFITINPMSGSSVSTNKYLPIAAFDSTQKASFYTKLYAQSTGSTPGGTPLRQALSRVGRHYAGITTGINSGMSTDPIQYSCQQNFALLTTDGYWNDSMSTPAVDINNNAIGSPDSTPDTFTPAFVSRATGTLDALGATTNTDTPTITTEQVLCTGNNTTAFAGGGGPSGSQTTCGCSGSQTRIMQRVDTLDSVQASIEGQDNGSPSVGHNYAFTPISVCTTPLIVTSTTPVTLVEQQVVVGNASSTFTSIGGVTSGMNQAGTCTSPQKRIKQRTTTYTSTQITTNGVAASPTASGVAYAFANIGSCVSPLVLTATTPITETAEWVGPEVSNQPTNFNASANNSTNPQQNYSCSGSGTRTIKWTRVLNYNKVVVTTDGVAAAPTYSGNQSPSPTFTSGSCDTSSKTAAATTVVAGTTPPPSSTGGPTPVAAANSTTPGTTTSTDNSGSGGAILSINFAPNPTSVNGTQTTTFTANGTANTLADVAMYYYKTDLRTGSSNALAPNNVPTTDKDFTNTQHMTTFTLGLGLQGTMTYQADYETNPNSDFGKIKSATVGCTFGGGTSKICDWPAPVAGSATTLDDLWHAAVNGRGVYFSASDPNSLASGLYGALSALHVQTAAASASATSSPNITQTNNFIYSTTFRTVKWDGEIVAQRIDTTNGTVQPAIVWSAQAQLDSQVVTSPDTRTIWKFDASVSGTKLKSFYYANLSTAPAGGIATEQNYFLNQCTVLSQCSSLSQPQKDTVNDGTTLVNYLRGQKDNETTLFRLRDHALGDPIDATPAYVQAANFNFADPVTPTYASFKSSVASRQGVLFVAANDGMLHAINGNTGAEMWAYIPRIVFPGLSQLATETWDANHKYSVDGSPQTMDVFDTAASAWKTILVGGLDKGGRGFYALDVTSPTAPKGMWEICSDSTLCAISDTDIGFSFGNPVITKRASDGKWVVLITSGMNNVSPGTGKGFLFVLDAITGAILRKVDTGVGTTTTPSGFSKIQAYATAFDTDNTALFVYGGDLLGNVWRFDMSVDPPDLLQMATLKDGSNNPQSITSRPELGFISGNRVVFIGTGRYLGTSDLVDPSTLNPALQWAYQQSFYALKDKFPNPCTSSCGYGNPRSGSPGLVQQTLTDNGTTTRTESNNPVSWTAKDGWFVDFNPSNSSPGERVNLDPQIVQNTILVITNVPNNSACTVGGDSFVYQFNYATGAYTATSAGGVAGMKFTGQVLVGFVTVELPSGVFKGVATGASGTKTPFGVNTGGGSNSGRRVGWRELLQW